MRELLVPGDPRSARAPRHVLELAETRRCEDTRILHIVWDEAGGYPRTSWGYEQWSVRPYLVGQGCDGTIEENMHLVALTVLPKLGIDYRQLYEEAYPGETLGDWPTSEDVAVLYAETVFPEISTAALEALLHDLYDTNHRTLEDLLRTRLEGLGHL